MCLTCTTESIKASAAAGGFNAAQPLLAAAVTALGAKSLGAWLGSQRLGWLTSRRIALASGAVALTMIVLGTLSSQGTI